MPRLSAAPAVLGAAITAALALWWLPGAWLQAAGGFAHLPALSAQAAFGLVLAQGVLVCIFAPRWFGGAADPGAATNSAASALSAVAPAWPLLALLWLTSGLQALVLVASQVLIALAAVLLALLGTAIAHSSLGEPARDVLRGAAGVAAAATVWSLRDGLHAWMVPA